MTTIFSSHHGKITEVNTKVVYMYICQSLLHFNCRDETKLLYNRFVKMYAVCR